MASPVLKELLSVPILSITARREPIVLPLTASIRDALVTLGQHGILSCPVVGANRVAHGFVDYLDIASYIMMAAQSVLTLINRDLSDFEIVLSHTVQQVIDRSQRDPYIHVIGSTPVSTIVEFFSSYLHRCAVYDPESDITSIVSQSDINRYVALHINTERLAPLASTPIGQVGWGKRRVHSVPNTASVYDALSLLTTQHISAIAVVDPISRDIVANFSLSDLRGIGANLISHLFRTVVSYLQEKSPISLRPMVITTDTTVGNIITLLATKNLHRVWIVGTPPSLEPIGSITLTDIMNVLYQYRPSPPVFTLDVPGKLNVTILAAQDLPIPERAQPYVIAIVPERRTASFVTTSAPAGAINPRWFEQVFTVDVDAGIANDRLLLIVKSATFIGSDLDIGYVTIPFAWILRGFGTGKAVTKLTEWLPLSSRDQTQLDTGGRIQLQFEYMAARNDPDAIRIS
jgi:CBS-domain-containing membrane protein